MPQQRVPVTVMATQTTKNGRNIVAHGGSLPGFRSYYGRYLNERVSVVVLTNGDDGDIAAIANGVADLYLKPRQPAASSPSR